MPKSKRGRPSKYEPVDIGLRSMQVIRTLGGDCTKAAAAVAFYDLEFDPTKPGEKDRLLDSSRWTWKTKAKRKSQVTGYSQLLKRHGFDFEQLRAAVAGGMSDIGAVMWLAATVLAKKKGKKIQGTDLLASQRLAKSRRACK